METSKPTRETQRYLGNATCRKSWGRHKKKAWMAGRHLTVQQVRKGCWLWSKRSRLYNRGCRLAGSRASGGTPVSDSISWRQAEITSPLTWVLGWGHQVKQKVLPLSEPSPCVCTQLFFMRVLGTKLRCSYLQGKYITEGDISSGPMKLSSKGHFQRFVFASEYMPIFL